MLPGLSTGSMMLLASDGGTIGARPDLPIIDIETISAPENTGSWSYTKTFDGYTTPAEYYAGGNYRKKRKTWVVSGSTVTSSMTAVGVAEGGKIVREYRSGSESSRSMNRLHGIFNGAFTSISWSSSDTTPISGSGFSGVSTKTWYDGYDSTPSNTTMQSEARSDLSSSRSSWIGSTYAVKYRGGKAYWKEKSSSRRVDYQTQVIPGSASGTVSQSGEGYINLTGGNGATLIDVMDDGKILAVYGDRSTLRIHNADGSLNSSRATATADIRCGAYNAASGQIALVGADNTLTYYAFSDLDSAVGDVALPAVPIDIAWPDGAPLFIFDDISGDLRIRCLQ